MTVEDLMEHLKLLPPGAQVRLALQPSWPLQALLAGVVYQTEEGDLLPSDVEPSEDGEGVVFLVQSDNAPPEPYAPRECWNLVPSW